MIKVEAKLRQETASILEERQRLTDAPISAQVRRAVEAWLENGGAQGIQTLTPTIAPGTVHIPVVASSACGPWREAIANADETRSVTADDAAAMGYAPGDVFITASGDSMAGDGIPDGALVLMRPLANGNRPDPGAVTLVQVRTRDGKYQGTIKAWHETPGGKVTLRDGDGKPYKLPADAEEVTPVAVMVGMKFVGRR